MTSCHLRAGPSSCRCSATGCVEADALVDVLELLPRGIDGTRIGAGTTLAELEASSRRSRTRCARPRAWPRRRSSGAWAPSPATCSRRRAAGTGASASPAACAAATAASPPTASTASTRSSPTTSARRRTRPTSRRRCRARRDAADEPARAAGRRRSTALPTEDDRAHDDARAGRADPGARRAAGRRVGLPEGDGPQALGVPDRRRRRRAARRRDVGRARRRRADPVAARGLARRRDAAARARRTRSRSRARSSGGRSPRSAASIASPMRRAPPRSSASCPRSSLAGCGGDDEDAGRRRRWPPTRRRPRRTDRRPRRTADRHRHRRLRRGRAPTLEPRTGTEPTAPLDASKTYEVTMDTNCGSFTIRLDQEQSPEAAASFVPLVQDGFFDDTVFHRIVPGFVIQGGDPTGDRHRRARLHDRRHAAGRRRRTRTASSRWRRPADEPPGTAGSQFFVVTADRRGACRPTTRSSARSTDGLEVVDAIGELGGPDEQPTQVVDDREGDRHRPRTLIAAVVLAAGAATRYGSPKQLVFLPYVLERLARDVGRRRRRGRGRVPDRAERGAPARGRARRRLPRLGARAGREPALRARGARRRRRGGARRARRRAAARPARRRAADRPPPRRRRRRRELRRHARPPRGAVTRGVGERSGRGRARARGELVACDDLEPPGDMDYPHLWQPPARR